MAFCPGRRKSKSGSCSARLYCCKKYRNIGCEQTNIGECSNQGFHMFKCLKTIQSGGAIDRRDELSPSALHRRGAIALSDGPPEAS